MRVPSLLYTAVSSLFIVSALAAPVPAPGSVSDILSSVKDLVGGKKPVDNQDKEASASRFPTYAWKRDVEARVAAMPNYGWKREDGDDEKEEEKKGPKSGIAGFPTYVWKRDEEPKKAGIAGYPTYGWKREDEEASADSSPNYPWKH